MQTELPYIGKFLIYKNFRLLNFNTKIFRVEKSFFAAHIIQMRNVACLIFIARMDNENILKPRISQSTVYSLFAFCAF